ncbi:MAG: 3-phosphoshikimate 1-carboxyvinyltransferase [Syntrophobacterales bacterium]|nr:MAG: 3-phosphoshikimate 1-carboxyvinyltransferase [Syntrophobacterales bacterium]
MKKRRIRPLAILDGALTIPGSKSYTARALVIGALASGETDLRNSLRSEDTDYMIQGLRGLGVTIEEDQETILISGTGGKLNPSRETLFLGGAGTAVRFLTTVAGLARKSLVIDGNARMRERPIQDLLDGLKPLGIRARSINGNGYPPVVIEDGQFEGGRTVLRGSKSSQFLSSILLCAPYAKREVVVEVTEDLASRSYVNLTMEIMGEFGARVTHRDYQIFRVTPAPYRGRKYFIEGDLSSAAYFFAAAAITGGRIRIKGVNPHTKQGDAGFLDALESMGCRVHRGDNHVEVVGALLQGIDVDMRAMPDTVQTLAVVAAFARGTTRIFRVEHLRYKETDRITALRRELEKMGIKTAHEKETLIVEGGEPRGAEVDTYGDHRMAMAFAVAGLRTAGMVIRDPDCVNKSFPTFWNLLEGIR